MIQIDIQAQQQSNEQQPIPPERQRHRQVVPMSWMLFILTNHNRIGMDHSEERHFMSMLGRVCHDDPDRM